ncbi:MAG: reverse transcriptase/maturase family protein [Pseudomonadota bacterium]
MNINSALVYQNEALFSIENIYKAYRSCRKGKRSTHNAMVFEQNLEENLFDLRHQLIAGIYQPKRSIAFLVEKPKRREIFAADFSDRVVHHLLVRYLEPKWESRFIHDSFACRKNKGTLGAVERLTAFSRKVTNNNTQKAYYLQLDIRGFFININRSLLYQRLQTKEKNQAILWLIKQVLFNEPTDNCLLKGKKSRFLSLPEHKTLFKAKVDCGLPIGNLSSQFFANVYLDALDQFVKHQLKVKYYLRYCDDFIICSQNKFQLTQYQQQIETFIRQQLNLELNPKQILKPISNGMDFLGYIIRPNYRLVRNRVIGNCYEKLAKAEKQLIQQGLNTTDSRLTIPWDWTLLPKLQQTVNSYFSHFSKANSFRLIHKLLKRFNWLGYYFHFVTKNKQCLGFIKYSSGRYFYSLKQQIKFFTKQLKDAICIFQVGNKNVVYSPSRTQNLFTCWIKQTNDFCGLIRMRQLVWQRK